MSAGLDVDLEQLPEQKNINDRADKSQHNNTSTQYYICTLHIFSDIEQSSDSSLLYTCEGSNGTTYITVAGPCSKHKWPSEVGLAYGCSR